MKKNRRQLLFTKLKISRLQEAGTQPNFLDGSMPTKILFIINI